MPVDSTNSKPASNNNTPGNALDSIADLLMSADSDLDDGDDSGVQRPPKRSTSKKSSKTKEKELPTNEDDEDLDSDDEDLDDESEDLDNESEESDDEETEDESEESDVTWSKVLGLDDKQIVLDEEGNFEGILTKVDGVTELKKIPEILAGYQNNKHNTVVSQTLAAKQKEFDTTAAAVTEAYTKKLEDLGKLTQYVHAKVLQENQQIDLQRLRIENPAEYAAVLQDQQMKRAELEELYIAIESERNETLEQQSKVSRQRYEEFTKQQVDTLLRDNPEWQNKERLKKDYSEMKNQALETYGFTEQEFGSIQDARMIEVLKDAVKYHKGMAVAKTKTKVNKQNVKFQKSGGKPKMTKLQILTKIAKEAPEGASKRYKQVDAVAELLTGKL